MKEKKSKSLAQIFLKMIDVFVDLEVSPGEKLRTVIPGVRNMKNVRRSLKDTLVKKYTDVIDQAE